VTTKRDDDDLEVRVTEKPSLVLTPISRRLFLLGTAGLGASCASFRVMPRRIVTDDLKTFAFQAVRPEDGLLMRIELRHFLWDSSGRIESVAGHSSIILVLPPQHIGEEAQDYDPNTPDAPPHSGLFQARTAESTRLVFANLPDARLDPVTLRGILLLCEAGRLVSSQQKREPSIDESRIEIPFRLLLSPSSDAWRLSPDLVTVGEFARYSLWTAAPITPAKVMPIFSVPDDDGGVFANKTPMSVDDRRHIVEVATTPLNTNTFFLTPLGGTLDLDAEFPHNPHLVRWQHIATIGRDQLVRIVQPGFLYPTGHKAMHIKLSRRRVGIRDGAPIAYLDTQYFVGLRERVLTFDLPGDEEATLQTASDSSTKRRRAARNLGLSSLDAGVECSPPLDPPSRDEIPNLPRMANPPHPPPDKPFVRWVRIRGEHYHLPMRAKDAEQSDSAIPVPVLFVNSIANEDPVTMEAVRRIYTDATAPAAVLARAWRMGGQRIAIAPSINQQSTAHPMLQWTMNVAHLGDFSTAWTTEDASFHAVLDEVRIRLPDVETLVARSRSASTAEAALQQVTDEVRRTIDTLRVATLARIRELQQLASRLTDIGAPPAVAAAKDALKRAADQIAGIAKYKDLLTNTQSAIPSVQQAAARYVEAANAVLGLQKDQFTIAAQNLGQIEATLNGICSRLAAIDAALIDAVNADITDQLRKRMGLDDKLTELQAIANQVAQEQRAPLLAARDALRTVRDRAESTAVAVKKELDAQAKRAAETLDNTIDDALRTRDDIRHKTDTTLTELRTAVETATADAAKSLVPLASLPLTPDLPLDRLNDVLRDATRLADTAQHELQDLRDKADTLRGIVTGVKACLPQDYLDNGFLLSQNPKGTFLALAQAGGLPMAFDTSRIGGLAEPNLAIVGISRLLGPLSGTVQSLFKDGFDPTDYFPTTAKLLGVVPLGSVLQTLTSQVHAAMPTFERLPDKVRYHWETAKLQPFGPFVPSADPGAPTRLSLDIVAGLHDEFTSAMTLSHFTLSLWDVIRVVVERVTFITHGKETPKIDVSITDVVLCGQLAFFQQLQESLKAITGTGGLTIERIGGAALRAAMRMQVPNVTLGMFSLTDLRFGADVELSLRGDPILVRFSVCDAASPFTIAVAFLGGGGHVALEATTAGIRSIEVNLEFGATLGIDLGGVAHGRVKAMGGISVVFGNGRAELTAYFTLAGNLRVIGILSVSLVFHMELHYESGGLLEGSVDVIVNVKIAFFSVEVTLHATKTFAGHAAAASAELYAASVDQRKGLLEPPAVARKRLADVMSFKDFQKYRRAFNQ
jgi:hypothetical protein